MTEAQYGFRPGRSTIKLLENFSDDIHGALDNNQFIFALFLDLAKAVHTIDHKLLQQKFEYAGFRGPFELFLIIYFSKRFQMVKIENRKSDLVKVNYGVPQDATQGPMIFNIDGSDLDPKSCKLRIFQYADDTTILLDHNNYEEAINTFEGDIRIIMKLLDNNCTFLSPKNTANVI